MWGLPKYTVTKTRLFPDNHIRSRLRDLSIRQDSTGQSSWTTMSQRFLSWESPSTPDTKANENPDRQDALVCCLNLSVSAPVITPRRRAAQAQDSMRRDVVPRCSETHPKKGPLISCARVLEYQGVSLVLWKSSVLGVCLFGEGAFLVMDGPNQVLFGCHSPAMLISKTLLEP